MLFAADLFNEGLDLPDVDTVLFLRPTESETGSSCCSWGGVCAHRRTTKPVLTVSDFVGHHRREFRFDVKLRALTGQTRRGVEREVERGFPFCPREVPDRHGQAGAGDRPGEPALAGGQQLASDDRRAPVLRRPRPAHVPARVGPRAPRRPPTWHQILDTAAPRTPASRTPDGGSREVDLLKRVRAFAHVDDALGQRATSGYSGPMWASTSSPLWSSAWHACCFFSAFPSGGGFSSYDEGLAAIRAEHAASAELASVVDYVFDQESPRCASPSTDPWPTCRSRVHASYQREEILAALDYATLSRKPTSMMQGGGVLAVAERRRILRLAEKKSEADYSPPRCTATTPSAPLAFMGSRRTQPQSRLPRSALPRRHELGPVVLPRGNREASTTPRPTCSWGRDVTPATSASARSRSPGSSSTRLPTALFAAAMRRGLMRRRPMRSTAGGAREGPRRTRRRTCLGFSRQENRIDVANHGQDVVVVVGDATKSVVLHSTAVVVVRPIEVETTSLRVELRS